MGGGVSREDKKKGKGEKELRTSIKASVRTAGRFSGILHYCAAEMQGAWIKCLQSTLIGKSWRIKWKYQKWSVSCTVHRPFKGFCVGAEAKEDLRIHLGAALHPADITGQDRSNGAVWGTWILQLTTRPWREFKKTFLFNQVQPAALFFFGKVPLKMWLRCKSIPNFQYVCVETWMSAHTHFSGREACWQTVVFCRQVAQVWIKPPGMRTREGERLVTFLRILLRSTQMGARHVQPEHDSSRAGINLREAAARWQTGRWPPSHWSGDMRLAYSFGFCWCPIC